jgi:flagellar biosynthesis/type III secretory pathway protein FliH
VYQSVKLVRADSDGFIYLQEGGGGFISFTNLAPATLQELGVPTNRIALAEQRALLRAEQLKKKQNEDAVAAQLRAELERRAAFNVGYQTGEREGESIGGQYYLGFEFYPTKTFVDSYASSYLRGGWDGLVRIPTSRYANADASLQSAYITGFETGFEAGFKKETQRAF